MNVRERRLAAIVISLVAAFIAWEIVLSPLLAKAGEMRDRVAKAGATIKAANDLAARADAVKARDAQLFTVKSVKDAGLVEAAFLEFLSKAADASGVKVSSERPSSVANAGSKGRGAYAEIQVALTAEATLDAFVTFINRLADGEKPFRVMDASLSRTDKAGLVAIKMRLSTVAVMEGTK